MYKTVLHKHKLTFLFFLNLFIITSAYSKTIIIAKEKVGEIKIGMPFKKVKKIVGKEKCKLTKTYKLTKIFKCKYGSGELKLLFYRHSWFIEYYHENIKQAPLPMYENDITLFGVRIENTAYQTEFGIKVGSKYSKVIQSYANIYFETGHYIPMEPIVGICIPKLGLSIAFENKKVDMKSIYDYEKKKLKDKKEVIFKDWLIKNITISKSKTTCGEGD